MSGLQLEWRLPENSTGKHPPTIESLSLLAFEDYLFVYGGYDEGEPEEETAPVVYRFHIPSCKWELFYPENGIDLEGHSATVAGSNMVVLCGMDTDYTYHNEIRLLDLPNATRWEGKPSPSDTAPCPRNRHTTAASGAHYLLVYGGSSDSGVQKDFWELDVRTWGWTLLSAGETGPIQGRFNAASAVFDSHFYLFGGAYFGENGEMVSTNDLYSFDLVQKEWRRIDILGEICPTVRNGHCMALVGSALVVFGGGHGADYNDLLYRFQLSKENVAQAKGSWEAFECSGVIPHWRYMGAMVAVKGSTSGPQTTLYFIGGGKRWPGEENVLSLDVSSLIIPITDH